MRSQYKNGEDTRSILGARKCSPRKRRKKTRISRGSKQCPVGIDLATLGRKWAHHARYHSGETEACPLDSHGERGRYASDTQRLFFLHDEMASRCDIEESS